MIMNALSQAYLLTGKQAYMDTCISVLNAALKQFTVNDVITESCELTNTCAVDNRLFKAILIRSLKAVYLATKDATAKASIKRVLDASMTRLSALCDAQMNCSRFWSTNKPSTDFHSQETALELVNTAIAVYGYNAAPLTPTSTPARNTAIGPVTGLVSGIVTGVLSLSLLLVN
jgi:hypothetical protein